MTDSCSRLGGRVYGRNPVFKRAGPLSTTGTTGTIPAWRAKPAPSKRTPGTGWNRAQPARCVSFSVRRNQKTKELSEVWFCVTVT